LQSLAGSDLLKTLIARHVIWLAVAQTFLLNKSMESPTSLKALGSKVTRAAPQAQLLNF